MRKTKHPGVYRLSDGRYLLDVKGISPKTGKKKRKRRTVHARTVAEAARLREELRAEILGPAAASSRPRVAECAESWFSLKAPALKPSTADRYARSLDLHILPALGDIYIDALEPADILRWRDAAPGAPGTVNGHLRVLRTFLADVTDELGIRNPAARARALPERRREGEAESNRLTAPELGRVLAMLQHDQPRSWAIILTQALTGMRIGEVAALRWEDIDREAGTIHVCRSVWNGRVGPTKTDRTRTVPLPELLDEVLQEHRQHELATQAPGVGEGWCFRNSVGGFPHRSTVNDHLRAALAAAEIPRRVTTHGLRRTLNNLARQVAAGEVVRSIIGHTTERMTEHYSWIELDEKRDLMTGVLRLVDPPAPEPESEAAAQSDTSGDTLGDGKESAG